ncbi:heparinase II/III family protein [Mariluticola halotolerans]|uniref:heparinase II/III family protein n=1 Tax=Mariluticola halotolerans TaxID=2909283 RepID=UPI0026E410B0|nr:heparinase II/III family protein [Mariluticola halotolerans]UJQ93642.1 heparinase II/III family protein [Mariluticola halotolerans]
MQQAVLSFADLVVRSPFVRWTWSGLADNSFTQTLPEFRPSDIETVYEMMAGRYLLASKLVDTQGVSPFAIENVTDNWRYELHGFSWLRHFRDSRNDAERRFARTLVLDWVGRNAHFEQRNWTPALTSVRTLNWLRHLPLLLEGATPDQAKTIKRSLGTQLQSLKLRGGLVPEPLDALFTAIALLGASLCDDSPGKTIAARMTRLKNLLSQQIDKDGLHRSRNAAVQFQLLTELVTVRQALGQRQRGLVSAIGAIIDSMHAALGMMTLGNGEPAYFNGCGQLPVDLVIAVQSQNADRRKSSGVMSGYGILADGHSTVIADSGLVPPPQFGAEAHAGGLSFEFSHGSDLVVGNCGPAPADLADSRVLFRQGAAHSGPTIDGLSSARLVTRGPWTGRMHSFCASPQVSVDTEEVSMGMMTSAYAEKFGVILQRNLTLISDGNTLVGQDVLTPARPSVTPSKLILRFHLAPGAEAERQIDEDIIQIKLKSGAIWTFLWEGGVAQLDESVRQSAYFGFFRTRQIVIEADVAANREISWIFTHQNG